MENCVNPGVVLCSLTKTSPASVRKKSTRVIPSQPKASNTRAAVSRMRVATGSSTLAGIAMWKPSV